MKKALILLLIVFLGCSHITPVDITTQETNTIERAFVQLEITFERLDKDDIGLNRSQENIKVIRNYILHKMESIDRQTKYAIDNNFHIIQKYCTNLYFGDITITQAKELLRQRQTLLLKKLKQIRRK